MQFPTIYLYTKYHLWIDLNETEAKVGITDFAQHTLGDIVYVDISTVGISLKQYEVFGKIESVRKSYELVMPVCGEILEINPAILSHPEIVNREPYIRGWIMKVKPQKKKERDTLLFAWNYKKSIGIEEDK